MRIWLLELWHFRELLIALTLREIKVRYKQTILGAAWAVLQPASLAAIFTIVFGFFLKVQSNSAPYPIFSYSALLPWTFFSTAVSFGALSVVNNGNLVTKVYFPREILPLASVGAAFFDFLMASLVFIPLLIYYHITINQNILFLLLIIPPIFLLTTGISFILSTVNVLFRDVRFVVPLLLQIWLYMTPIIYSIDQIPEKYRLYLRLNPMTTLVDSFRNVIIFGSVPNFSELFIAIVVSTIIFFVGYQFFKNTERVFADVM